MHRKQVAETPELERRVKPENFKVGQEISLVREQALENLRAAIVSGFYQPGDRLIERELCEMIGVSRTSIREVLRQLEAERLIKVEPRKGPTVASISLNEARDIYEARKLLEGSVAKSFVENATAPQVRKLRKAAEDFETAAGRNDLAKMVKVMSRFYDVLLTGAGSTVFRDLLTSLHARISFLRGTSMSQAGRVKHSIREIYEIVDAIERKDAAGAEDAATRHVENAANAALGGLQIGPAE